MKLGFFGMPQGVSNYREGVDACVANGLEYIELYNGWEFDGRLMLPELIRNARRWKEYADSRGIRVSCFSAYADVVGENRAAVIQQLKNLAEVCEVLGCPYLHHTLAPSLESANTAAGEVFEKAIGAVREIYDYAEAHGVKCLYEPQGLVFNGCQAIQRFLSEVGRDVGLVADFGNPLFVGESAKAFVTRFAHRIAHVHIKDYLVKESSAADPGKYWYQAKNGDYLRDTIIGHGHVPIRSLFRILLEAGYTGAYSLECGGLEHAHPEASALDIENTKRFYQEALQEVQAGLI